MITAVCSKRFVFMARAAAAVAVMMMAAVMLVGCSNPADNDDGSKEYSLTTAVTGGGSVSRDPDKATYSHGDYVTVIATALPGYTFTGWSGASTSTENSVTITMTGNKTLTANFKQGATYTLTTISNPENGGGVSVAPNKASYIAGESVTVTAVPSANYTFTGWEGASVSTNTSVTITMNADKILTANFEPTTYKLTTNTSPSGAGTISVSPNKTAYDPGDIVVVTVTAEASGYTFTGWSGASSSTEKAVTVTMNGSKTLTANFAEVANAVIITLTYFSTSERDVLNGPDPRISFTVEGYSDFGMLSTETTGILFNRDNISTWTGEIQSSRIPFSSLANEVRIRAKVLEEDDISNNDDISPAGYSTFKPIPAVGSARASGSETLEKGIGKSTVGYSYRFVRQ